MLENIAEEAKRGGDLPISKYLCVHGHFYQPPREDPFNGSIPNEPGAFPYKNWNERIHAECYKPNADLGNYEKISFNFGPTLHAWMEVHDPDTCHQILKQDQANLDRYGVGNAIAQAYNHTILPLDSYQDKVTQILWGIADFEHSFGRRPQGMWLPEAAVDNETLTILCEHGIMFTILAPWQADTMRVDSTEPYRVCLPEGRCMAVFFYHQELSGGVSFNPSITLNADDFVQRELFPRFQTEKMLHEEPQLLLIASDGELYGHHQPFRDRFLAHLTDGASSRLGIQTTYPALWLKKYPPKRTMTIREFTSWSCHHGVKRWSGNCNCSPGDGRWKAYLRGAFDHLTAALDKIYINQMNYFGIDPWDLRNRYIQVILGQISLPDILGELSGRKLDEPEILTIHSLLESQRERLRMYTSCGWFFEDFDRIEPRNNVAYAARAVYLVQAATGIDLSDMALQELRFVVSNRSGLSGDEVFHRQLRNAGRAIPGSL
jgi:alpha-amylase/alpha-mannosidase (GH57 family)